MKRDKETKEEKCSYCKKKGKNLHVTEFGRVHYLCYKKLCDKY